MSNHRTNKPTSRRLERQRLRRALNDPKSFGITRLRRGIHKSNWGEGLRRTKNIFGKNTEKHTE